MYLYKIARTNEGDYDTYDSAVVVASSAANAQKVHPDGKTKCTFNTDGHEWQWDDGENSFWKEREWVDPKTVEVTLIGIADPTLKEGDVIVASYNAG